MANYSPNRTGLTRYYARRRIEADVAVHRVIARLSKRTDVPPPKAEAVLVAALRSVGVTKRTLQRYWQAEIAMFREILRKRYRSRKTRRSDKILTALGRASEPLVSRKRPK